MKYTYYYIFYSGQYEQLKLFSVYTFDYYTYNLLSLKPEKFFHSIY